MPPEIYKEAFTRVARSQLTESRRKLVYCYKLDFEAIKAAPRRDEGRTEVLNDPDEPSDRINRPPNIFSRIAFESD